MRQIWSQAGLVIMLAVCAAAWRWGARLERRAAAVIVLGWTATLLAQRVMGHVDPVAVITTIDTLVFLAFLALSWGDRSGWVIYAVACQGVALGVHAIRAFAPAMTTWTYLTALAICSYGVLAALAWGTWLARRTR